MDHETNGKKIINCKSCGAEFDSSLPNCPYCGRMNLPAAEAEYMAKLESIRGDLEDLGGLAGRKTKAHSRVLGRKLVIAAAAVILIAAVVLIFRAVRDREDAGKSKEEYLWQREAFEQMDGLYAAEDWGALAKAYRAAMNEEHNVWQYKHSRFCDYLLQIEWAEATLQNHNAGLASDLDLFADEIELYELDYMEKISDEERALLEDLRSPLIEDFEQRFGLSEEELSYFLKMLRKDGFVPYKECERFLNERGVKG